MFSCVLNKGITNFKNVFDLFGQIGISEVSFAIDKDCLSVYTTFDKCIHVSACFSESSFSEYHTTEKCISTLSIKSMKENLKNVTSVDTLELSMSKGRELRIKVCKKTIEFEKKIQLKEAQFYKLPKLDQIHPLTIKASDFLEFCRSITGKYTIDIRTEAGRGDITLESDKSKTIIKSDYENTEDVLPFHGEFKAEYFGKLKKLAKFNSNLRVYPNPKQPLMFETTIGTKDALTVWIKSLKQIDEEYDDVEDDD